jgi:hypothetical protein
MEHTLLMNNVGGGVGSQIREKYIQGGASGGVGQASSSGGSNNNNQVLQIPSQNANKRRGSMNT